MGLFERIIKAHGRSGVRTFNQMRLSFTVCGPLFILGGFAGLLDIGAFYSNGKTAIDLDRIITSIVFIGIGFVFSFLRLSVFRKKRPYDKENI